MIQKEFQLVVWTLVIQKSTVIPPSPCLFACGLPYLWVTKADYRGWLNQCVRLNRVSWPRKGWCLFSGTNCRSLVYSVFTYSKTNWAITSEIATKHACMPDIFEQDTDRQPHIYEPNGFRMFSQNFEELFSCQVFFYETEHHHLVQWKLCLTFSFCFCVFPLKENFGALDSEKFIFLLYFTLLGVGLLVWLKWDNGNILGFK